MAVEEQTLLATFGMDWREIATAAERAQQLVDDEVTVRAMLEFVNARPAADRRKCDAVLGANDWLSEAGRISLMFLIQEDPSKLNSWDTILRRVLIYPPNYRDLADWWLFFTALEAATGFQLERCTAEKREQRLTGHLLEALAAQGKIWSDPIASVITRAGAMIAINEIDLEVGGGEQATGGDFGLILDFDGRTVQPSAPKRPDDRRIIPIIFQAKRYARPTANVSQTNATHGPQRTLLASNNCASVYVFYENLNNPPAPLPPLVKPVDSVPTPTTTDVLADSLDLATFLLCAATNPARAPRAQSSDDALRMIFSKADLRDLSALVIVSSDPEATSRYRSSLSLVKHEMAATEDQDQHTDLKY